jgi:hypothetical protein
VEVDEIVLVGTELDFIATSIGMIAPNQTSRICGSILTGSMLDSHSVVVVLTMDVGSEVVVIIISDEDVF